MNPGFFLLVVVLFFVGSMYYIQQYGSSNPKTEVLGLFGMELVDVTGG